MRMRDRDSAVGSSDLGWTRRLSTRSSTFSPAVAARAIAEVSSAACRPTIDPPSTTPVAGSETIFTNPRGAALMRALAVVENGTLVTRILRQIGKHTSELQSLMRISYAVFCLKKKKTNTETQICH